MRIFLPTLLLALLLSACGEENGLSCPNCFIAQDGGVPPTVGERSDEIVENDFITVRQEPTSTFSTDADGAAYAQVRRSIQQMNRLPGANAVRTEELINYFALDYPYDDPSTPINLNGEISACPWAPEHRLLRIGIQGRPPAADAPPANFVLLIDVSGSMSAPDKLGMLQEGFRRFVDRMRPTDRIAIVTYAGEAGVVLPSTPGSERQRILDAINGLGSGGSTAGAAGLSTAYEIAGDNFITGGNNRIIVGTDGDFNVGPTSRQELLDLIEDRRATGVYLTILGVGVGYNDSYLEQIANHGNGTFEYLDKVEELDRVFVHEVGRFTAVAQDVKVQVTFDPALVRAYRLIGYENRLLNNEDFTDDTKDAGEIGAGQSVTALYELIPETAGGSRSLPALTVDFRYKPVGSPTSLPLELGVFDLAKTFAQSSPQHRFVAGVVAFAQLLRDSPHRGTATYDDAYAWVSGSGLADPHGYVDECAELIRRAGALR